ncbi:unnamed protein product [Triticum turgidum subsp. durum]|uniref:Uncharacterized protein n=1 Tax=Triticum turgidum subsp. durum TaxID=4567 RepID=A0A9R0Q5N4_TRITD|nr:unnamed protein product [Triticum turgidum subsp. durum]
MRYWKQIGPKNLTAMCTGCFSWAQIPSVNLGISRTRHLNRLQILCNARDTRMRLTSLSMRSMLWQLISGGRDRFVVFCVYFPTPWHGPGNSGAEEKSYNDYVAATPDLMLGYLDFYLGGDEKRPDLPTRLHQRFPMSLIFGGDGSYMAPFSLHSDSVVISLISQVVPSSIWHRLVVGLNAQLRLVRHGNLKVTFLPMLKWLETHANPALDTYHVRVDLAWFQATALGYCQYGLVIHAVEGEAVAAELQSGSRIIFDQHSLNQNEDADSQLGHSRSNDAYMCKRITGGILNVDNLMTLKDRSDLFHPLSLILHNTKPVGHQDLVGLVISILLLADFSLVLLTSLQLYSYSMVDILLVLFVLPLGILAPFPAGINALFSHGPRRSAGLARVYALWNITSLVNVTSMPTDFTTIQSLSYSTLAEY